MNPPTPTDDRGGELIHRICPGCGSDAPATQRQVRAPVDPEPLPTDDRAAYWRGFRSRSCFFTYPRCDTCGLLYCPTYFSKASLEDLYASMPDNTAGAPADVLAHTQKGYIDFLRQQGPLRGTYLEVGPDIGLATSAAVADGDLERVVLIEPNLDVHDELKNAAGSLPATVAADLADLEAGIEADTAVLIHVLDHLTDPVAYLRNLRTQLADDARILVVVHNEASVLRRVLGVRWPPFTLQHPQLFSPDTLKQTLAEAGFSRVTVRPTTNVFPVRHVVKTAAALVGLDGGWTTHLPTWRMRIRLGNIMAVAS